MIFGTFGDFLGDFFDDIEDISDCGGVN